MTYADAYPTDFIFMGSAAHGRSLCLFGDDRRPPFGPPARGFQPINPRRRDASLGTVR